MDTKVSRFRPVRSIEDKKSRRTKGRNFYFSPFFCPWIMSTAGRLSKTRRIAALTSERVSPSSARSSDTGSVTRLFSIEYAASSRQNREDAIAFLISDTRGSDVSGLGEDSGLDIAFLRIRFNADKPAPGTVGETKFRAQNPADPGIERGGRGSSGPVP